MSWLRLHRLRLKDFHENIVKIQSESQNDENNYSQPSRFSMAGAGEANGGQPVLKKVSEIRMRNGKLILF